MCDILIKNEHIINDLNLDTPIYKFVPLRYVLSMFINRNLYYGKTSTWEDSYENFFLKQHFRMNDGTLVDATTLIPGIFGMCWTVLPESDALWRIYSNYGLLNELQGDNPELLLRYTAVRIKTTARKLFDATYRSDADSSHVYIGKVEYISGNEIDERLQPNQPINPLDLNIAWVQSMFIKRIEFKHEHEVRSILTYTPEDERSHNDSLVFNIEPQDFIEELTLDPRLTIGDEKFTINKLEEVGANPDIINKSQLYSFNRQIIQLQ